MANASNPLDPTLESLSDCGCCTGTADATPQEVGNPPGLSEIAYRVGKYPDFRSSLLAALSSGDYPALSGPTGIRTRETDDPTIALLDAFAVTLDILTFYQERIANEHYLRTATERRSIRELARSLGYELAPGIAAATYLAFAVEDAPCALAPHGETVIPRRTPVQSVPGPNEKPQTFETDEEIHARPAWNELHPRRTKKQIFDIGTPYVWLGGVRTNLKVGDAILLYGDEWASDQTAQNERWDFRIIREIHKDNENNRTKVTFDHPLGSKPPRRQYPSPEPRAYALRKRAAIFGHNAPDWTSLPNNVKAGYLGKPEGDLTFGDREKWPRYTIFAPAPNHRTAHPGTFRPTAQFVAQAVARATQQKVQADIDNLVSAAKSVVEDLKNAGDIAIDQAKQINDALSDFAQAAATGIANISGLGTALSQATANNSPVFGEVANVINHFADLLRSAISPPLFLPIVVPFIVLGAFANMQQGEQGNTARRAIDEVMRAVNDIVNQQIGSLGTGVTDAADTLDQVANALNAAMDGVKQIGGNMVALAAATETLIHAMAAAQSLNTVASAAADMTQREIIITGLSATEVSPAQFVAACVTVAGEALKLSTTAGLVDLTPAVLSVPMTAIFGAAYNQRRQEIRDAFVTITGQLGVDLLTLIRVRGGGGFVDMANTAISAAIAAAQPQPTQYWSYTSSASAVIDLDAIYPEAVVGCPIILRYRDNVELFRVTAAEETSRAEYLISAKTSRLTLLGDVQNLRQYFDTAVRETSVYLNDEELEIIEEDDPAPIQGNVIPLPLKPVPLQGADAPYPGQRLLIQGFDTRGAPCSESVFVRLYDPASGRITLRDNLTHAYRRADCKIFGNVAQATHGETRSEVLGSGNAGRTFPTFTLKSAPLTFVPDDAPTGTATTLEVEVNETRWRETLSLYQQQARDRVYTVRLDDNGRATIQFGDGTTGARLPTGNENIRATYRQGIGQDGNVGAGQLSQLLRRPFGVRSVQNPMPAEGGTDPQHTEDARENAPHTALTMGRIVSLSDYADFALGFAGIERAHAAWVWFGDCRGVFLTIAGDEGKVVPNTIRLNLEAAIRKSSAPHIPFRIADPRPKRFTFGARLFIATEYNRDRVLTKARSAVLERFAFRHRNFAERVAHSEIIALLQNQRGVAEVEMSTNNLLIPSGNVIVVLSVLAPIIVAETPRTGANLNTVQGAELLELAPDFVLEAQYV